MFKRAIFLIGTLAVCSIAVAGGIEQTQDFGVGMFNGVDLLVSMQNASSNNFLGILNDQSSVSASQTTEGALASMSHMGIVGSHFSWSMSGLTLPTLTLPALQTVSIDSLSSQMPSIDSFQLQ